VADEALVEHPLGTHTLLEGGFLRVVRDTVRLPDGRTATREYVHHGGAVAVIPVLDDGRAVLVRQWRHPLARVLLEWPAGKLDAGESPLACGVRELAEETGCTARRWARAGVIHNAAAYSSEGIHLYLATGLARGPQRLDDGEFVQVVHHTEAELEAMAIAGTLTDVKTLIGMQWWRRWREGTWSPDWTTPDGRVLPPEAPA
jgi:ADP-ribose pyrophosphatase